MFSSYIYTQPDISNPNRGSSSVELNNHNTILRYDYLVPQKMSHDMVLETSWLRVFMKKTWGFNAMFLSFYLVAGWFLTKSDYFTI